MYILDSVSYQWVVYKTNTIGVVVNRLVGIGFKPTTSMTYYTIGLESPVDENTRVSQVQVIEKSKTGTRPGTTMHSPVHTEKIVKDYMHQT